MVLTAVLTALCFNASAKNGIPEKDGKPATTPASPTDITDDGDPEILYWFSIGIRLDAKKRDIEILSGASKIMSGTKKVFEKAVWKGVGRRQIVIGPFPCKQQAENATIFYKKTKEKVDGMFLKNTKRFHELECEVDSFCDEITVRVNMKPADLSQFTAELLLRHPEMRPEIEQIINEINLKNNLVKP